MRTYYNCITLEKKCENSSQKVFKNDIAFSKNLFNFHNALIFDTKFNGKHVIDFQDTGIVILNLKIMNSAAVVISLIKKGYYNDAYTILRNIRESRNLVDYFIENPKAADDWIHGERFAYSSVNAKIKRSDPTNSIYKMYCDFTHSNFLGVIDHFDFETKYPVRNGSTKMDMRMFPIFNEKTSRTLFRALTNEYFFTIRSYYDHFKTYYWINFDAKYRSRYDKIDKYFIDNLIKEWIIHQLSEYNKEKIKFSDIDSLISNLISDLSSSLSHT
jgi:hypothetical protein